MRSNNDLQHRRGLILTRTSDSGTYGLPRSLRNFTIALLALALLAAAVEWLCRRVLGLNRDPYDYPFLREYFPDFQAFVGRFHYFHTPAFFAYPGPTPVMYPAPVTVFYQAFYLVPHDPLGFFLYFIVTSLALAGICFGRVLRRRGIAPAKAYAFPALVLLGCYPAWFELKQANMEIVVWVLLTAGVALFLAGRGYPAVVCFGIAGSMKLYPIIYLGLLLARRQYRQIALGVCVAVVVSVASLWLLCPQISVSWHETNKSLETFRYLYMLHRRPELGFDHSLLSLIKLPRRTFPSPMAFAPVLSGYLATVAVAGLVLFFVRIRKLPMANQVLCLTLACIFLPPVSFEYTLLHLLVPAALLALLAIDAQRTGRDVLGLNACLACLALLLGTMPELIALHHRVGGQLKAMVLVVLFYLALRHPLTAERDGAVGGPLEITPAMKGQAA